MKGSDIIAAERLERYRRIVPEWAAFRDAVSKPLPLCLWTNRLRTNAAVVERHLDREGIEVRPVNWFPGAFKGSPSKRAGQSMPFVAGLYHIQEEVSLLPAKILAPEPGERVLDLCSAPGNKTAQMAVAMDNSGTIIANDRNAMRTRATRGVLDRMGIINTTITTSDASNLPDEVGRFDRVLADVPCTCEATTRKHVDALLQSGREASLRFHRRQSAILRKAIQLCRPGGRIVYATCTYAPEENEMVIDAALREDGDQIEVLPARIEGFRSSPGITEWDGTPLDPALAGAMRVWPHQNDSGGFFVALLSKRENGDGSGGRRPDDTFALSEAEQEKWLQLLNDRFGIPQEAFEAARLHEPNNKYVAVVSAAHESVDRPRPVSIGMPLIRIGLRYPKLTTAGARLIGRRAVRNTVRLDDAQASDYTSRKDFYPTADQVKGLAGTGYVIVEHAGAVLGVGLYLEEKNCVKSMFPKVLSRAVAD